MSSGMNVTYPRVNGFERSVAICVGSLATTTFLTPLEVVKTRVQAEFSQQTCKRPKTSLGWTRHIISTDGAFGLYRGYSAFLLQLTPNNLIYFWTYELTRDALTASLGQTWAPMLSGVLGRTLATYAVAPFELVKTQFQSGHMPKDVSILNALRTNTKQGGFISLWRGVGPTLWRDVPFSAIYWVCYESFKRKLSVNRRDESAVDRFRTAFLSGLVAGTIAGSVVTPFDVVKTLRQAQVGTDGNGGRGKSTLHKVQMLWHQGRVSAIFAGLGPRLLRVPPGCALMISSYEMTKYVFEQMGR